MAVYSYRAMRSGTAEAGVIAADTPRQARDLLRNRGLIVREMNLAGRGTGWRARLGGWQKARPRRLGRNEARVTALYSELSTLLAAGIPLLQALSAITRQTRGPFKARVLALQEQIASGAGLAEAMRSMPDLFDPLSVSVVEVGERAGKLDDVLSQLATFRGRARQFRGRVATAMIYPAIVLTAGLGVTLFLMTFVVPQMLDALVEMGQQLPLTTRVVKAISDALVAWWWLFATAAVVLGVVATAVMQKPAVRRRWHRLQLNLPIVGELLRKQIIVRIAITMAVLTRSGVEFVQALSIARRSVGNMVIYDALLAAEEAVSAGRDIAPALEATNAFPPTVVQIVEVGQSTGSLDAMLDRLAVDYDQQVQVMTQRMLALFEPVVILLLATVIGFVVLSVILPYLEAGNAL